MPVTRAGVGTSVDSAEIVNDSIVNADINSAAAITYSKLNLASSITTADLAFNPATQAELDATAGGVGTLAARPAASSVRSGTLYYATNTKVTYLSDGSAWSLLAIGVLAQSAVAASGAADTNENTLATVTVPANAMGANGRLRVAVQFSVTNSGNNKTLRVRFGGVSGTAYYSFVATTSGTRAVVEIANRNATNSQAGGAAGNNSGGVGQGTTVTGSVDTTAAADLVITGQKASAGETLTLENYMVELIPG